MLSASKGKSMKVEVWGEKDGKWLAFKPFEIKVAEEPIDEYISYRLIEPTYVAWSYMSISQRNVSSFEENEIFNNEVTSIDRKKGQCINTQMFSDVLQQKLMGLMGIGASYNIDELASNMTYMELSTNPRYMDEFVAACFLPHTNRELFPSSVQE